MHWWEKLDGEGIYEVETDLGRETWQAALDEIQSCDRRLQLGTETTPGLGTVEVLTEGPATSAILQYFQSNSWYQHLVDLCIYDESWCTNWTRPTVNWFKKFTQFDYVWYGAPPNYTKHQWHVDCLRTVIHGMMFFGDNNDAEATTLFRDRDQEIAITTGFDRGWIILQNGRQTHRGINLHPSYRYSFKWMLTLRL